ncbi:hypothetical protein [Scytonema sp. NUACC21]
MDGSKKAGNAYDEVVPKRNSCPKWKQWMATSIRMEAAKWQ